MFYVTVYTGFAYVLPSISIFECDLLVKEIYYTDPKTTSDFLEFAKTQNIIDIDSFIKVAKEFYKERILN